MGGRALQSDYPALMGLNMQQTKSKLIGEIVLKDGHIERLKSRVAAKDAEIEHLQHFVDFVNLWCNLETKISDGERLSAIKFHPTAQAALKR